MKRPHIIYILSDEHCGMAMSHLGDPNVRTPNMDRLAVEGVSFSRAYCNSPICTPSRGTIFSGRHAHAGPVQYFFDVYKATAPSTATLLRQAGYHTAYFGKWHCGIVRDQIPPQVRENRESYTVWPMRTPEYHRAGFQDWYGFEVNNAPFQGFYYESHDINPQRMEKYQTDELTDLALNYLQQYDRDQPLFLVLSVEPPHFPLDAPQGFQRFSPGQLQTRANFRDSPHLREQLAMYYAMIENLDRNIGRMMEGIAELPDFKSNTCTVYFSDHGDYMGSHGAINRKEYPQEESIRIPAIFHWPGTIPAQGQREELFSLVDLLPTTLGLLGQKLPPYLQGRDFSPPLRGGSFQAPEAVLLEMCGNPRWSLDYIDWRGFVSKRWKYAFFETGHEWLFDLENDPGEENNLAAVDTARCAAMRRQLLTLLQESREPYFDVLIEHGVSSDVPTLDVSESKKDILVEGQGLLSPAWTDGTIVKPQ